MSFLLTETMDGRIIEVTISDKLTREAIQAFIPLTEAAIEENGKIRVIFLLLGFHGWDAGVRWEDVDFNLQQFNDVERLAIVGETKWEAGMSSFCRPFTSANIKYFEHGNLDRAREWIRG